MKKNLLVINFCFCLISFVFAESSFYERRGNNQHVIMFANSTIENGMFDKSDDWVCQKIKENLIASLNRYGGFQCLDMASSKDIIKIQKELESGVYNEDQSIKIGKLLKAKEVINIKTTRLASGSYSLNVSLYDVETGRILGMYNSSKVYDSADSYVLQSHYDCLSLMLNQLGVKQTAEGKRTLQDEILMAQKQAEANKRVMAENAKKEAEQMELSVQKARILADEKARREAEYEANKKAIEEKKAQEVAAAAAAKMANPFYNETYVTEFENGSKYDKYIIKFTTQNECFVTVISENSRGETSEYSATGNYTYKDDIFEINVRMKNENVRHVQKINWKGIVSFSKDYNSFYFMIPVNSSEDAKKNRAEFFRK